jgi:hypothetical protein
MTSKKKPSKKDAYRYRLSFLKTTKMFLEKELQEHDKTIEDSIFVESAIMSAIYYLERAELATNALMGIKFKAKKCNF